jgi:signal transduction histidine kinase
MSPAVTPTTLPRGRSFQQRLRESVLAFSRNADSRSTLPQALEAMAAEAATLTGATRASIWLHDRRAHELWLAASSDASEPPARVAAGETGAPISLGLTLERPTRLGEDATSSIVAPLRGWRRALGTLVLDGGVSPELTLDQGLELVHDVARHLSGVIENLQLVEEVVRQHRLLKDSFNSLADLLIVTDNGLRVVQTNDALAWCLGRRHEDLLDAPLATLVGEELATWVVDDSSTPDDARATPSRPSRARTGTFDGSPLGGTVVVTVTPLVNDDNDLIGRVIVSRDVTRQIQLEVEREALRTRLTQSEKLASLGQFVAGVAHEINNPLQGVLGYVELLMRSDKASPVRGELRRVMREADRAARIVRNLLVFSGSRRMVRRRLTIERVIGRAFSSRRASLARRGIEVVRHQPDDPLPILGDPLLLQQAVLNVLVNAEHAIAETGGQGTIDIATTAGAAGRTVVTRIRDTGPGIDHAVLARIFDPFFTTKEVNQGTGLGLTIAYGIVQEHGGAIHAANAPDGGAVFTIELPVATERPARPASRRRRAAGDA